ncbi:transporter substrate-binding domain-containing protein [Streptomyces sp. NPDC050625]|uniref:substrate-binding periplasmic protein n=1 Tax=Streptomyces sp. NPDC050625 TaxID=3154629 RepID=UPI003438903C
MRITRRLASRSILAVAVTSSFLLAGCGTESNGSAAQKAQTNPYGLIDAGTIRAATQLDHPPFEYGSPSGKPIGFIVDVTDEAAKRMKLKVDYKSTTVPAGLAGLTSHQYDLAAMGLGITEEREKSVDFTKPLFWSSTVVLTTKDSNLSGLDAFAGKKVGAVTGSSQEVFVDQKMPTARAISFPGENSGINQLMNGSLDAFVVGGPSAEHFMKAHADLRDAASAAVDHPTSMAVSKNHRALLAALDKQITAMVHDGTYARLYRKWFTTKPLPQLVQAWPELATQFKVAAP